MVSLLYTYNKATNTITTHCSRILITLRNLRWFTSAVNMSQNLYQSIFQTSVPSVYRGLSSVVVCDDLDEHDTSGGSTAASPLSPEDSSLGLVPPSGDTPGMHF